MTCKTGRAGWLLLMMLAGRVWAGDPSPVRAADTSIPLAPTVDRFSVRIVASGFEHPWEITWGPDNFLWITERTGKRVVRVHPVKGTRSEVLIVDEAFQNAGQDGVLGMALHPDLLQGRGRDYVYLAYSYDAGSNGTLDRRIKIRRYTYNRRTQGLRAPRDLITDLPASSDHNAGRLQFGPDGKLYYSIGDQGSNQFDRICQPIVSQDLPTREEVANQDWTYYAGKILRFNPDGSIPADNPRLAGVRSHVYSYGFRNPQGLVFASNGLLYVSEHGPKTDDEIDLIQRGGNYGWPYVAGYQDDQAYAYENWSAASDCASLTFDNYVVPPSVPQQAESAWQGQFKAPLKTFFTVPTGYSFQDPACTGNFFVCWPSLAPSSLDFYAAPASGVRGWKPSLLLVSLKRGAVYRFPLNRTGRRLLDGEEVFHTVDRYRDIAIAPDGRTFYVVTDNDGETSGANGGFTATLANPGAILAFRYRPIRARN